MALNAGAVRARACACVRVCVCVCVRACVRVAAACNFVVNKCSPPHPALHVQVQTDYIDGSTVWLDLDEKDPARRVKMAAVFKKNGYKCYTILESPDGIHWRTTEECTGPVEINLLVFNREICSRTLMGVLSERQHATF